MPEDQREVYDQRKSEMESILSGKSLTRKQKDAMRTSMEFGYAAAFCARTCDMNGSMFRANDYENRFKEMQRKLAK